MTKPSERDKRTSKTLKAPPRGQNKRSAAQTRKLLGKHYANKYGTVRGGG